MYKKRNAILPLILSIALILSAFPATAQADSVVDLTGTLNITEGDPAVLVDTSATIASGDYANGYVQMSTSTGSQYDQLSFQSAANPNAEGAISFSGSTVYLGDGSSTLAIGNVDSTYNGQNGQPLRVNFVTPMENSGFESGSSGWALNNSNYYISGDSIGTSGTYTTSIEQESSGNHYLHLSIRGTTNSYGTGHGPTATSSYFEASPGDIITFDWKAAKTSDYYDVYAYLINDATGQKFQILYQRGSSISSWQKKQITLNSSYLSSYSDKLKFMFVCGSYDQTGGRAVGSTMDIDNARVVKSYATPQICQNILRQIKYQNTSDDPVASLDLVAQLKDKYGSVYSDSKPCYITPVNDAPSLTENNQLTLNEAATATITNSYLNTTDVDDTSAELTYTITGPPSNGTLKLNGSALSADSTFTQAQLDSSLLSYSHNGTKTTSDSFTFMVADGCEDGVSPISATFSIDVNSLPTVDTNSELNLNEGAQAAIGTSLLTASDIDNTSAQLTYTITSAPDHGTLYKNGSEMGNGSTITQSELEANYLSYSHDGGESSSDSFSFRLSDPASYLDDTFSISVNPVNDSPSIATNNALTLFEGTEATITTSQLNEGDPDDSGNGLTYTLTSNVVHGTLYKNGMEIGSQSTFTHQDIIDSAISYMHNGTETTSDSFGFSLADGGEDGATTYTGTFNISITLINDQTTTSDQTYSVNENASNGTQIGAVLTYDEENDPRTFAITGGNDSGLFAIDPDTGMITVAGAIDYDAEQQHLLTVTVTEHYESTTRTVTMTATVNVNNMHDIPFTPSAADLDASSDKGRSDTDDITNDTTPKIFGAGGSTMFNNTINVYVDGELDGTAQSNAAGEWNYTLANALDDGQHDITITTTDFGGDTSAESEAFTVTIDTAAPAAGSALGLPLGGNTTDDRTPTMAADGEADCIVTVYDQTIKNYGIAMTDSSGDFSFTVSEDDSLSVATYDFTYTLTDTAGNVSALSNPFSLTVNDPPQAQNTTVSTQEDTPYVFKVSDFNYSDLNSDGFEILRITVLADDGTLKYSDGSDWSAVTLGQEITTDDIALNLFAFFPDADENASPYTTFKFKVSDGTDYCTDVYTATINVTPVNDSPTSYDQEFLVFENAPIDKVVGTVDADDIENDTLVFSITAGKDPGVFRIDPATGTIYVAAEVDHDTIQQHVLTVQIEEESGEFTITTRVTINVENVFDIPKTPAVPDLESSSDSGRDSEDDETNDNTPTVFGAADSTMAETTIKVYVDGVYDGQTVSGLDGAWSYTAKEMTDGQHDITITSTDLGGDVSFESSALSVLIDTTAPVAALAMEPVFEGYTTDNRTPSFTGVGEAHAIITVYDQNSKNYGTVLADENGDFSFTVSEEDALSIGNYELTFTQTDISGNVSEISSALSIIVNDPPEAADTEVTTDEDIAYVFSAADFNYTDANDDVFTSVMITQLASLGSLEYFDGSEWLAVEKDQEVLVSDISNGRLRYSPPADENGEDYTTFRFKVGDGIDYSYSDYEAVINLTPVNDVQLFTGLDGTEVDYLEDQGTALLDEAKASTVTDIDDTELGGGTLTVSITENAAADEDMIAVTADASVTLSDCSNVGSTITVVGEIIGTITESGLGKDLVIELTPFATLENIEKLIYAVTYENVNTVEPAVESRTVTFTLTDSDDQSANQNVNVNIERTEIPTVETLETTRRNIDADDATSGGEVLDNGRAQVTEVGIVYSLRRSFVPSDSEKMSAGEYTSEAQFEALIKNLPADTVVYYAAYALNSEGYGYGEVMTLRTHLWSDRNGDGVLDNPSADTDGDGVCDGDERAAGSDPDEPSSTPSDKDGDGKVDKPSADTDGDGVSDADEQAAGSDPDDASSTPSDKDGDGKVDKPSADTDGDGVSDADEQAAGSDPDDASSTPSDKDGDGKVDKPSADTDGDGVSDEDEIAAGSNPDDPSSTPSDIDGDGKLDTPSADSDGDGVSDEDEIAAGSDPDDPYSTPSDKDGNGEIDDPNADSDGDGISDADEIAAGSDPDDPMSKPVAEGQAAVLQRPPVDAPAKPASGSASAFSVWQSKQGTTKTAVALGWDSVSGADYYLIWSGNKLLGTVYGAESCIISGLETGTVYELRVGAFTMGGERVAESDKLVGVADIAAATYSEDGLPLEDILSEYFGGDVSQVGGTRYDLTGQITDENGVPLPGLTVELHSTPRTTVTDDNGWYYFDNVEKGEHTIYVYYNSNESDVALKLIDESGTALAAETSVIYFDTSVSRTSTFILNMSVNEEGAVTIERVESYPAVFSTEGSNAGSEYIWWILAGAAAILFVFFFILFKRRRKKDEEEQMVTA